MHRLLLVVAVAMGASATAVSAQPAPLQLEGSAAATPWKRYGDWNKARWDNYNTLAQPKLTPPPGGEIAVGEVVGDAAVEAPPAIGTDERRMHVRAYELWLSLLHDRDYPSIGDLDADALGEFGPHSVLLDFSGDQANPAIAYLDPAEFFTSLMTNPSKYGIKTTIDAFVSREIGRAHV